jgi:hypothetical protein
MPHGRHTKDERKEIIIGNFSLDSSSHQIGDAAFTPRHTPSPRALECKHRLTQLTQLTQHATHESQTKFTLLYAKGQSAQPEMLWRTHHTKPDPYGEIKID